MGEICVAPKNVFGEKFINGVCRGCQEPCGYILPNELDQKVDLFGDRLFGVLFPIRRTVSRQGFVVLFYVPLQNKGPAQRKHNGIIKK